MPECPHCHQYFFGNPEACPKCYYNFQLRRAIVPEEVQQEKFRNDQHLNTIHTQNGQYEYRTEFIPDTSDGMPNRQLIDRALALYAADGWRLHTMATNEVMRKGTVVSETNHLMSNTAITSDITILIFERCLIPAK